MVQNLKPPIVPLDQPRRLRSAIVGLGAISEQHLAYLAGQSPFTDSGPQRSEIVAVCDLSVAAAKYAATTYGASQVHTDIGQMLNEASPDVVHVLTPPTSHFEITSQALMSGAHVICEKPVATSTAQLEELLSIAGSSNRFLTESHNYRFNSDISKISRLIDSGDLGHIREIEIRISLPVADPDSRFADLNMPHPITGMPAGVIHDFITHFSYLLLHLASQPRFDKVTTALNNYSGNPNLGYDNLDVLLIGTSSDGPLHCRVRFDAITKPDTFTVLVKGSRGWAKSDLFQPCVQANIKRPGGSQLNPIINQILNGSALFTAGLRNFGQKLMQRSPYEGLHIMLDKTYHALQEGHSPPVNHDDLLATAVLIDQILEEKNRI